MNRISNVMSMHLRDKFSWTLLPWIIVFSSFFVNYALSFIVEEPIYTGGISSIYIYLLVAGIVTPVQIFPFALGFSVRRTDFFFGTLATIFTISVGSAIVLMLLSVVEHATGGWGTELHFFHLPYLNDGTAIEQLIISFSIFFHCYFIGFVISSVFRRFGRYGMFTLFIALGAILTVAAFLCTYYDLWGGIFDWFAHITAIKLALWLLLAAIVYALLSYLLLRRATV